MGTQEHTRKTPAWRKWATGLGLTALALVGIWAVVAFVIRPEYAPTPSEGAILNPDRTPQPSHDIWGRFVSAPEAAEMAKTDAGRAELSPARGAVPIDEDFIREGRRAFYEETFGNEVFITDVVGVLDGPLSATKVVEAITALGGAGTDNLRVELAETVTIAGRTFREGDKVDTGLDVPAGGIAALGMKIFYEDGRLRVGVTCALCHSTVDPETKQVIDGAPNTNLNIGLMMALAPNSAAFFPNAEIESLEEFVRNPDRTVMTSDGERVPLPDPVALEEAVDAVLMRWPPGQFDSTIDLKANPSKFPNSFTLGDHPYGWTGFAMAGPFRGLSMLSNNVHAMNADASLHAEASDDLFGIDKELYLATLLQNAAAEDFRYDPAGGRKPSEFFDEINPTDSPGLSHTAALPTYPKASLISPNGLWISVPGRPLWRDVNAISAFENALRPPPPPIHADAEQARNGRAVFERANCTECHSGPYLTNNRVIPLEEIGTEPKRAPAKKDLEDLMRDPTTFGFDTPVPVPAGTPTLPVLLDRLDEEQIELAWAFGGKEGGYKVPALIGLYYSAPYLHDGGVAVGPDPQTQLGMAGTLLKAIKPDPFQSLKALVDRGLREKVVEANRAEPDLDVVSTLGIGHEYWVDEEAGFSAEDQRDLILYLLTVEPPASWEAAKEGGQD